MLAPGEKKSVTVAMEPLALASYNMGKDGWEWLPGEYTVWVGGSSRSLGLTAKAGLGK